MRLALDRMQADLVFAATSAASAKEDALAQLQGARDALQTETERAEAQRVAFEKRAAQLQAEKGRCGRPSRNLHLLPLSIIAAS